MITTAEIRQKIMSNVNSSSITVNGYAYNINGHDYHRVTGIIHLLGLNSHILDAWKNKVIKAKFLSDIQKQPITQENAVIKLYDALNEPKMELERASILGTAVHQQIENHLANPQYQVVWNNPKEEGLLKSYLTWHNAWNVSSFESIGCELKLWSNLYKYAGTADWLAREKDDLVIYDWKTSNTPKITYLMQLAAYWKALKELYDLDVHHAVIVNFKKDGSFPWVITMTQDQVDYYFTLFLYLVELKKLEPIKF